MERNEKVLVDALLTLLNVEGAAMAGARHVRAYAGLDTRYHFDQARSAMREVAQTYGADSITDLVEW